MPCSPVPYDVAEASNPCPSSDTMNVSTPSCSPSATRADVASAYFVTLLSASRHEK